MNVLFFLTPKSDVAYIYEDYTIRQALEKMKHYGYSAIPIISRDGRYVGTATEGDFLWYLLREGKSSVNEVEHILVKNMERKVLNKPVNVESKIEDLILTSMNQNFIPVIDDNEVFIGIITRKDIIQYCYNKGFSR
ncbi:Inosine-5'-monophosphate dehydrogenase [Lachnospiraceae bacterium KM106-2]|nr:Inosine-5'-monophosphate dehydrogenase [Lachnospiraceae bacterium KM106-2]